jgi:glycosyl transferase family 2
MSLPKVTFGIIVLNGEPFARYCLRALYPFAHQIIVVEGAVQEAAGIATADGHSTDGTLEGLYRFQEEEDAEGKLDIVTRNEFWSEKDEQSRAYASRATGDYLWQVDIDEFYHPDDMRFVLELLRDDPKITAVSFKQITFWGGFDYITDGWYLRRGADIYHRLFKWGPGYHYVTHRPPTVCDEDGRDQRKLKWVGGHELARRGIFLYHYSLLFPQQVLDKAAYYDRALWVNRDGYRRWAEQNYFGLKNPFRVHNVYDYPSWLERFEGQHPPQIELMRRNLEDGLLEVKTRDGSDIDRLLLSRKYRLGRMLMRLLGHVDRAMSHLLDPLRPLIRALRERARKALSLST